MAGKQLRQSTIDTLSWLSLGIVIGSAVTVGIHCAVTIANNLFSGRQRKENDNFQEDDEDDGVTFLEEQKRERLPDLVILIRHGQSEGNIDKTKWWSKPDNQIELTKLGIEQAKQAGKRIESIFQFYEQTLNIPMNRVHVHVSPFKRTIQTAKYVREAFEDRVVRQNLCPRLREQEFGNLQSDEFKKYREEQKRVGRFWYRFPTGESGADGKKKRYICQENSTVNCL